MTVWAVLRLRVRELGVDHEFGPRLDLLEERFGDARLSDGLELLIVRLRILEWEFMTTTIWIEPEMGRLLGVTQGSELPRKTNNRSARRRKRSWRT